MSQIVTTFSTNLGPFGWVEDVGGTKTAYAYPTYTTAKCGRNPNPGFGPAKESRAIMQFDTSSIPVNATILQTEFLVVLNTAATPGTGMVEWFNNFYIGNWVGATLDTSDYSTGSAYHAHYQDWSGTPGAPTDGWITFAGTYPNNVTKGGNTDILILDSSTYSGFTTEWNFQLKTTVKLRVTWKKRRVIFTP